MNRNRARRKASLCRQPCWTSVGLMCCTVLLHALQIVQPAVAEEPVARIVFIGDSITDGHTYPLLVEASLKQAGHAVPVCINAGVAGDTAKGMLARLDRDVFPHRPTLVTISAGINDVLRGVSSEDYARDVQAIAECMAKEKIPLVILTPSILGPKHAEAQQKLGDYITALRQIAAQHNCQVAEVHEVMRDGAAAGVEVLGADQIHLSFVGYRHFTRALLDALGYRDVEVAQKLKLEPMPGLVTSWQVRALEDCAALTDETLAAALDANHKWRVITLPMPKEESDWWTDQERQRGFVQSLGKHVGEGRKFLAQAKVSFESTQEGYLNLGAQAERVWLNGKLVYKNEGWTGWHAGKERIFVTFAQGQNILVVESGDSYFVSITAHNDW